MRIKGSESSAGPGSASVEFTGAKNRATSLLDLINEWDVVDDWCCVPRKGWGGRRWGGRGRGGGGGWGGAKWRHLNVNVSGGGGGAAHCSMAAEWEIEGGKQRGRLAVKEKWKITQHDHLPLAGVHPTAPTHGCQCVCVEALSLCMWVSPHTGEERECVCFAGKSEDSQIFFFVFYFSNAGVDFTIIRFTVQHFVNCSNLTCTLTHTHNTHNTTQARRVLTLVIKNGSVHM